VKFFNSISQEPRHWLEQKTTLFATYCTLEVLYKCRLKFTVIMSMTSVKSMLDRCIKPSCLSTCWLLCPVPRLDLVPPKRVSIPLAQSWQWVTNDPRDPSVSWPMTQTMARVDHYLRIMMSSRLLSSILCNLEFWILLMQCMYIEYVII